MYKQYGKLVKPRIEFKKTYLLGMSKTGSTSLSRILKGKHEYKMEETIETVYKFLKKDLTKEEYTSFIKSRDEKINGFDSSTFNHLYLDLLLDFSSDTKFILTIRDCHSWIKSMLNQIVFYKYVYPSRIKQYVEIMFKQDINPADLDENFLKHNPKFLDYMLLFWSVTNQNVLNQVPSDRLLVIKTDEINESIRKLASFLEIPGHRLETVHLNKSGERGYYGDDILKDTMTFYGDIKYEKIDWFRNIDKELLNQKIDFYCGNLMNQFFNVKENI